MTIVKKVRSVEKLFSQTEKEIFQFQRLSGLQCLPGCGACCTKPDIEATALEFLPYAYYSFMEGTAYRVLEKLRGQETRICHLYMPSIADVKSGKCSQYHYRGLICRLFGFSAIKDKYGISRLVTCSRIKEYEPAAYARSLDMIKHDSFVPVITDYYTRLAQIDLELGTRYYPVNEAMKQAIEIVLHYYAYRKPPKPFRKAA